jgi:hypothetical protein
MFVFLSHGKKIGSHWTDFHEIWYLSTFSKNCGEISSFIEIKLLTGIFEEDVCTVIISG